MKLCTTEKYVRSKIENLGTPCIIPIVKRREGCQDPAKVYFSIRHEYDSSYLLESLIGWGEKSRYSTIGCKPLLHLRIRGDRCELNGRPDVRRISQLRLNSTNDYRDELEILKSAMFMDEMKFEELNLPRYVMGITGYLSYDFVGSFPELNVVDGNSIHPILEFMLPHCVIVFDHLGDKTYYASLVFLTEDTDFEEVYSDSIEELNGVEEIEEKESEISRGKISVDCNIRKAEFEEKVREIKEYIRSGDVIQTVLSRRIDLSPRPSLEDFYSKLREVNPSPYMFFLDLSDTEVIGSSPEALVRVSGKNVLTRPIAGTRPRGKTPEEDREMERDLLKDDKERAEHVMLVDLGRNDIGKVSNFGTVNTPEFMEVEKYGHVQHIVSTVEGILREDKDSFDALRAVFPAGTVTGAPKIRAMEIIDELEADGRGIYSGAVGSFSFSGDADFAIAIRTLTAGRTGARVQVGAGIVADSDPSREYDETEDKARSLLKAAGVFE